MPDKSNEPDLVPFDDAGKCKHTRTRKLLESELYYCEHCGMRLTAPMGLQQVANGEGGAI